MPQLKVTIISNVIYIRVQNIYQCCLPAVIMFRFNQLPFELQCYIFRNYFSTAEKLKLLHVKEFGKVLTAKYSWINLPKISLKNYMCISKNYLHILKPGLYKSNILKTLYEITVNEETGVLALQSFVLGRDGDFYTQKESASMTYNISEFQALLMKLRNTSTDISEHSYFNSEHYISLHRPSHELFQENIIYETDFDQLSCRKGKHLYIMNVFKRRPINELKFHMKEFMRRRNKDSEMHTSYKIFKMTHWRKCLKSILKVRYVYKPRKNVIFAKGIRKSLQM